MAEYSQGTIRKRRKSKGSNEWVWEGVVHKTADGKTRQLSHVLGVPCDPPSEGETKRGRSSVPAGRGARQAMRLLAEWRSTLIDRDAAEQVKDGGGRASDEKVIDFLDRYWETRGFSAVTKDGYDNLRKHIDSPVLDIPIVELTPAIVQRWIDVRRKAGDSDNILNKSLNQLKYACRWGVRMQELSSNPCDPVTPPKRSHRDPNPLSEGDVKRLRTMLEAHRKRGATQSALADAALLALLTGMRIGELCGLAWDDIDGGAEGRMKPDGFIHVNNVVTAPKGGMVLKPSPKNGTRRDVPMNEEIVRALSRRRADIASVEGEDLSGCYVLAKPDSAARFASPDYLGKRWSAFVETTDMKGAEGLMPHFHDLRHTFATQALTHGIDVATVASILGHKNPATTLKYYTRWMPNTNAKAMRRMGDMMSGKEASEDERLAELVRSASGNLVSLDAEQKKALLSILGSIE